MLRRKPTRLELKADDKEELEDARKRVSEAAAAAAAAAATPHSTGIASSSSPAAPSKQLASSLLSAHDRSAKPSIAQRIGLSK